MIDDGNTGKTVMVLGKHMYTVEHVHKLLHAEGFGTICMLEEYEELERRLLEHDFDMLLIVGSVEPHFKEDIIQKVKSTKPFAKIIVHHGGPATIPTEVQAAFGR